MTSFDWHVAFTPTSLKAEFSWPTTTQELRGGGFLMLLLSWPLALQISSFAIGRVRVDDIRKNRWGRWRDGMQTVGKGVGSEKDNPTRIDRDTRWDREMPKLRFYYI
jgi:hypothetical protein